MPGSNQSGSPRQPSARAWTLAASALLAVIVLLTMGLTSAAGRGSRVHVPRTFFGVIPGPTAIDKRDAAKIARTRVGTVRIGLDWSGVQRQPGPFNWSAPDRVVARLAARRIEALPTLAATPSWVAPKPTTPPLDSDADRSAWRTFVTAAVRRYGPGGSFWASGANGGKSPFHVECRCDARPTPIKAWQVWNEPNLKHYFTPTPDPNKYAQLVKLSSTAIRQADSKAKVVLAGLSDGGQSGRPGASPYLKSFYGVSGIKQSFDAVSVHPYARTIANLRTVMKRFRSAMRQSGDSRTPLWVTEIGWGSAHPDRFGHNKGLRGQARMLKRSMTLLVKHRKRWHVGRAYWFFWRDPPESSGRASCSFCHSAGLLKHNRRPKPAYKAFQRLTRLSRTAR